MPATLRTKLALVVLVPLVAVAVLGVQRFGTERSRIADAEDRQEQLTVFLALTDLQQDLYLEAAAAAASQGAATGPSGALVDAYRTRFREAAEHRALTQAVVAGQRDRIAHVLGTDDPWARVEVALDRIRSAREQLESADEDAASYQDAVVAVLTRTEAAVDLVIDLVDQMILVADPVLARRVEPVATLAAVERLTIREALTVLAQLLALAEGAEPLVTADALRQGAAEQAVLLGRIDAELPAPFRTQLDELLAGAEGHQWDAMRAAVAGGATEGLPPLLDAGVLAERRVDGLASIRRSYVAALTTQSDAEATNARRDANAVGLGAMGILLLTLLLVISFGRHVLRNLQLLTDRAKVISSGDLDVGPLALTGHDETVLLGEAFDGMGRVLGTLRRQTEALAAGDYDAAVLREQLPGPIGADLHLSVQAMRVLHERTRASEALAHDIVATAPSAIIGIGHDGRIRTANPSAATLLGLPLEELTGPARDLRERFDLLADPPVGLSNIEAVVRRPDGTSRTVLAYTRHVGEGADRLVTVYARDITDRKELEGQLAHQSAHDDLTGLANRATLPLELERASARARRQRQGFGVLFVDIDGFKAVNESHGHRVGDELLQVVADRLRQVVRDTDFLARVGGDEFVVIAEYAPDTGAVERLARRIVATIGEPVLLERHDMLHVAVSASVGISWFDDRAEDPVDLLRNADLAMYRAKATGPGALRIFDGDMKRWVASRLELEADLRDALRGQHLSVMVQPIVELATGRVHGAELLCRWIRPGLGPVSPETFVPVAEESALIHELGAFVLDQAIAVMRDWAGDPRLGRLSIHVNVSARQVTRSDFVDDIRARIRGVPAGAPRLVLELTETALPDDIERTATAMRELAAAGVGFSIDDFGVGFASFGYLRQLPVQEIKVDRSIIAGLTGETANPQADEIMVTMLSQLGTSQGARIIAEGIEHESQRRRLLDLGCQYGQGFLFAQPMPVADFARWRVAHEDTPTIVQRPDSRT